MSRHTMTRFDRVAQMSMQEEIIARKKQEILERQKTTELAKQVVAAQVAAARKPSKKDKTSAVESSDDSSGDDQPADPAESEPAVDPQPSASGSTGLKNCFNNDGSFFENFKKITEAARQAQLDLEAKQNAPVMPLLTTYTQAQQEQAGAIVGLQPLLAAPSAAFGADFHPAAAALCAGQPPPPPPPPPAVAADEPSTVDGQPATAAEAEAPADATADRSETPRSDDAPALSAFIGTRHSDDVQIPGFGFDSPPPVSMPAPSPTNAEPADDRYFPSGDDKYRPAEPPQMPAGVPPPPPPPAPSAASPNPAYVNPFGPRMQPQHQLQAPPPQMHFQPHAHMFDEQAMHRMFSAQSQLNAFGSSMQMQMHMQQMGNMLHHQQQHHQHHLHQQQQQQHLHHLLHHQQQQHQHHLHPWAAGHQQPAAFMPMVDFAPPSMPAGPPPAQPQAQQQPNLTLDATVAPAESPSAFTATDPAVSEATDHSRVFSDHEFIPTSVESLIELVAENGDEYEDRLRSRKNDLHPSLWFLFDVNCNAYQNYRGKVLVLRYNTGSDVARNDEAPAPVAAAAADRDPATCSPSHSGEQAQPCSTSGTGAPFDGAPTDDKYDPADVYNDEDDDEDAAIGNATAAVGQPQRSGSPDYDSDSEYMQEAKRRNFGQQLKRKQDIDERQLYGGGRRFVDDAVAISSDDDDDGGAMAGRSAAPKSDAQANDSGAHSSGSGSGSSRPPSDAHQRQQKRSRWGQTTAGAEAQQTPPANPNNPFAARPPAFGGPSTVAGVPLLSQCKRSNPALLAYAIQSYGSTDLDDETWRKCEDHFKVNLLYQDMLRKRNEMDRLARAGRHKYEYDSDEDVEGGTWEHKARTAEMEATAVWSDALTKQAEGKHHIGDFLPPEELRKFMEKYEAQQTNREPDLSDYREYKLREDNKGFQMLQKLGWKEGQGLGFDGAGIVDPVNKAQQRDSNQGLGLASAAHPDFGDNEYDAYRKRMMLAYRFRPNPLNNPRRSYY